MNIWVELVYEALGKPYPIGRTDNSRILVLVKHQLLSEAKEKCDLVRGADELLERAWAGDLSRLQELLDLLVPPEIEELMPHSDREGDGQGQNEQ